MKKIHLTEGWKGRNGFTLMELLIVLSLISIIFVLGYSILYFSRRTHTNTVNKVDRYESLKQAAEFISNELSTSFYLEINNIEYINPDKKKYGDKFIQSNGSDIRLKMFNKDKDEWEEKVILNYKNNFTIKKSDEIGDNNTIIFSITIIDDNGDELESLSSRVFISNLQYGRNEIISIKDGGAYVLYNNTTKESALPKPGISTGCFIATATYGSATHPYITLLTEFRDEYLAKYALGRVFINKYYKYSPKYASFIEKSDFLRFITRILLAPIVIAVFTIMRAQYYILILLILIFILYVAKKDDNGIKTFR